MAMVKIYIGNRHFIASISPLSNLMNVPLFCTFIRGFAWHFLPGEMRLNLSFSERSAVFFFSDLRIQISLNDSITLKKEEEENVMPYGPKKPQISGGRLRCSSFPCSSVLLRALRSVPTCPTDDGRTRLIPLCPLVPRWSRHRSACSITMRFWVGGSRRRRPQK